MKKKGQKKPYKQYWYDTPQAPFNPENQEMYQGTNAKTWIEAIALLVFIDFLIWALAHC